MANLNAHKKKVSNSKIKKLIKRKKVAKIIKRKRKLVIDEMIELDDDIVDSSLSTDPNDIPKEVITITISRSSDSDEVDVAINGEHIAEKEPLSSHSDHSEDEEITHEHHGMLEQIMFRVPCVSDPFIGTPKDCQKDLDALVIKMQRMPKNQNSDHMFDKIHLYMHGYLIHVVLKKFPFIKGYQTVDIYQETLIALRFKAIPGFEVNKGMSFLNFAKMCIRRHLITLLNTSKTRKKDQAMNQSVSLDSPAPNNDKNDSKSTFANTLADTADPINKTIVINESYKITRDFLMDNLSSFEQVVLGEYLSSSSYKEISKNVSKKLGKRHNTKSIDNALLRIRKKAIELREDGKLEDTPIFFNDKE
jgi:RNA polymerase sporulation-specific sigma factor